LSDLDELGQLMFVTGVSARHECRRRVGPRDIIHALFVPLEFLESLPTPIEPIQNCTIG
jgi:hypothetical protein